jgi:hypothetical protein
MNMSNYRWETDFTSQNPSCTRLRKEIKPEKLSNIQRLFSAASSSSQITASTGISNFHDLPNKALTPVLA